MMRNERQQRDRTPGEAVHGLPVAGTTGVCPVQPIVGILDLPGLPRAGADHRCMSYGSGQEAVMSIKSIKRWIPLVLITAVVLTVSWLTMMYIVALYILFGGGI